MVRNTCEFVVGHLLEIRVAAGYRVMADVDEMIAMMGASVAKLPPTTKFAIAADWRAVQLMPPDTAERARVMLARSNPRVKRSSILTLQENPLTNLQVIRLIREAESPLRRHFTSAHEQHAWLSEVLTESESARLATFLELPGNPPFSKK
jgi:hypothetical protein